MLYFLPSHIPKLKPFSHKQRTQLIDCSLAKLSPMQRIAFRVCKLLLITPIFWAAAAVDGPELFAWILVLGLLYPIVVLPVRHAFVLKHLDQCIAELKTRAC